MIITIETILKREPAKNELPNKKESTIKEENKMDSKSKSESEDIAKKYISTGELVDIDENVSPLGRKIIKGISLDPNLIDSPTEEKRITSFILPNEEEIDWSDDKWQIKVLKPF